MAAGRMRSGFNNEVESDTSVQPGAQSWTRSENNVVSPRSELSGHQNRARGRALEFINVFNRGYVTRRACFLDSFFSNGQQWLKCFDPVSDSLQTAGRAVRRPHCF